MANIPTEGKMIEPRIMPMLAYDDAPAAIDFLCRAFGFAVQLRMDMPDGKVGHAELAFHDGAIALATTWTAGGLASPRSLTGIHTQLLVAVPDVDAHHAHARDAGATIAMAPEDQPHGSRIYRAIDPEGHRWVFASPVRAR
jgi:uncharacterized glyoxalase superfamily protein PhnB